MIIIVQKHSQRGEYYEFTDLDTGVMRKWYPPQAYREAELKIAFETIARSFQYTSQIGPRHELDQTQVPMKATKDMTLFEFCEKVYLPRKIVTIAENTRDRWVNSLDTRIYPELGNLRMADITSADISDFLTKLQSVGLAQGTVDRFYTILKSIFKMAFMMDLYDRSPMEKVERPRSRKDELLQTTPDAYTAKEIVYLGTTYPLSVHCMLRDPLGKRYLDNSESYCCPCNY